jgi:hypothetical protein
MTVMPLPDELLLLGIDDTAGRPLVLGRALDLGVAGAVLVELVLAGRLAVQPDQVTLLDPDPVGDAVAEAALDRIRRADEPLDPKHWVRELAKGVREQVLDRLVAEGVVEREESWLLGVFHRTRYPLLNPAPETAAQLRLDATVRHGQLPGRHTVALAALLDAVDLGPTLYPDLPDVAVRADLATIAAGDWAGADPQVKASARACCAAVRTTAASALDPMVAGSFA